MRATVGSLVAPSLQDLHVTSSSIYLSLPTFRFVATHYRILSMSTLDNSLLVVDNARPVCVYMDLQALVHRRTYGSVYTFFELSPYFCGGKDA